METDEHSARNLRKRKNSSNDDDINGDDARGGADDRNNSNDKRKRHDNPRGDVLTDSTIRSLSNVAEGHDDGMDTETPIPEIKRERKKKNTQRDDKPKTQRMLLSDSEPTKRMSMSQQHGVDSTSSRRFEGTTAPQTTSEKESKKKGKKKTNKLTTDDTTTRHIGGTATAQRSKNKKSSPSQKERKKDRISGTDTRSTESQWETESTSATSAKPKERDRDSDDKKDDTESQSVAEFTSASSAFLNERDHDSSDEEKDDQSKKQQVPLSVNESRDGVVLHSESMPSPIYDNSGDADSGGGGGDGGGGDGIVSASGGGSNSITANSIVASDNVDYEDGGAGGNDDEDDDDTEKKSSKRMSVLRHDNESTGDSLYHEADTTAQTVTLSKRQNISDAPSSEENVTHQTSTKRQKISDANITILSPKRKGKKKKKTPSNEQEMLPKRITEELVDKTKKKQKGAPIWKPKRKTKKIPKDDRMKKIIGRRLRKYKITSQKDDVEKKREVSVGGTTARVDSDQDVYEKFLNSKRLVSLYAKKRLKVDMMKKFIGRRLRKYKITSQGDDVEKKREVSVGGTTARVDSDQDVHEKFFNLKRFVSLYEDNTNISSHESLFSSLDQYINPGLVIFDTDTVTTRLVRLMEEHSESKSATAAIAEHLFNQLEDGCRFEERGGLSSNDRPTAIQMIGNSFVRKSIFLWYLLLTYHASLSITDEPTLDIVKSMRPEDTRQLYDKGVRLVQAIRDVPDENSRFSFLCICILNQLYQETHNRDDNRTPVRCAIFARDANNATVIVRARNSFNSSYPCIHSLLYSPSLLFVSARDHNLLFVYSDGTTDHIIAVLISHERGANSTAKVKALKIGVFKVYVVDQNVTNAVMKRVYRRVNLEMIGVSELDPRDNFELSSGAVRALSWSPPLDRSSFRCFLPLLKRSHTAATFDEDAVIQVPFQVVTRNVYGYSKKICAEFSRQLNDHKDDFQVATGSGISSIYEADRIFEKLILLRGSRSVQSGLTPVVSEDRLSTYFLVTGTLHRLPKKMIADLKSCIDVHQSSKARRESVPLSLLVDPTIDEAWQLTKSVTSCMRDAIKHLHDGHVVEINNETDLARLVDKDALCFDEHSLSTKLGPGFDLRKDDDFFSTYSPKIKDEHLRSRIENLKLEIKNYNSRTTTPVTSTDVDSVKTRLRDVFSKNNALQENIDIIADIFLSLRWLTNLPLDETPTTPPFSNLLSTPYLNEYSMLDVFRLYLHSFFLELWCCLRNVLATTATAPTDEELSVTNFKIVSFAVFLYASSLRELLIIYSSSELFSSYYRWGYGLFDMTCKVSCLVANHLQYLASLQACDSNKINSNTSTNSIPSIRANETIIENVADVVGKFPFFTNDDYFGDSQIKNRETMLRHIADDNPNAVVRNPLREKTPENIYGLFALNNDDDDTVSDDERRFISDAHCQFVTVWNEKTYDRHVEENTLSDNDSAVKERSHERHRRLFNFDVESNTAEKINNKPWEERYDAVMRDRDNWGYDIVKSIRNIFKGQEGILNTSFDEPSNIIIYRTSTSIVPYRYGDLPMDMVPYRYEDTDHITDDYTIDSIGGNNTSSRKDYFIASINTVQYILRNRWENVTAFDEFENRALGHMYNIMGNVRNTKDEHWFNTLVNTVRNVFNTIRSRWKDNSGNYSTILELDNNTIKEILRTFIRNVHLVEENERSAMHEALKTCDSTTVRLPSIEERSDPIPMDEILPIDEPSTALDEHSTVHHQQSLQQQHQNSTTKEDTFDNELESIEKSVNYINKQNRLTDDTMGEMYKAVNLANVKHEEVNIEIQRIKEEQQRFVTDVKNKYEREYNETIRDIDTYIRNYTTEQHASYLRDRLNTINITQNLYPRNISTNNLYADIDQEVRAINSLGDRLDDVIQIIDTEKKNIKSLSDQLINEHKNRVAPEYKDLEQHMNDGNDSYDDTLKKIAHHIRQINTAISKADSHKTSVADAVVLASNIHDSIRREKQCDIADLTSKTSTVKEKGREVESTVTSINIELDRAKDELRAVGELARNVFIEMFNLRSRLETTKTITGSIILNSKKEEINRVKTKIKTKYDEAIKLFNEAIGRLVTLETKTAIVERETITEETLPPPSSKVTKTRPERNVEAETVAEETILTAEIQAGTEKITETETVAEETVLQPPSSKETKTIGEMAVETETVAEEKNEGWSQQQREKKTATTRPPNETINTRPRTTPLGTGRDEMEAMTVADVKLSDEVTADRLVATTSATSETLASPVDHEILNMEKFIDSCFDIQKTYMDMEEMVKKNTETYVSNLNLKLSKGITDLEKELKEASDMATVLRLHRTYNNMTGEYDRDHKSLDVLLYEPKKYLEIQERTNDYDTYIKLIDKMHSKYVERCNAAKAETIKIVEDVIAKHNDQIHDMCNNRLYEVGGSGKDPTKPPAQDTLAFYEDVTKTYDEKKEYLKNIKVKYVSDLNTTLDVNVFHLDEQLKNANDMTTVMGLHTAYDKRTDEYDQDYKSLDALLYENSTYKEIQGRVSNNETMREILDKTQRAHVENCNAVRAEIVKIRNDTIAKHKEIIKRKCGDRIHELNGSDTHSSSSGREPMEQESSNNSSSGGEAMEQESSNQPVLLADTSGSNNNTTDPHTILEFASMVTNTIINNRNQEIPDESNVKIILYENSPSHHVKEFAKYTPKDMKRHDHLTVENISEYVELLYRKKKVKYLHPLHFTTLFSDSNAIYSSLIQTSPMREREANEAVCKLKASLISDHSGSSSMLNDEAIVDEVAVNLYRALRRCSLDALFADPGAHSIIRSVLVERNVDADIRSDRNSSPKLLNSLIANCIYYDTDTVSTIAAITNDICTTIQKYSKLRDIFDIIAIGLITAVEKLCCRYLHSAGTGSTPMGRDTVTMVIRILELVFGSLALRAPSTSIWKTRRICYQLPFLSVMIECVDRFLLVAESRAVHLRSTLNTHNLSDTKMRDLQSQQNTLYDFEALDKLLIDVVRVTRNVRETHLAVFHNVFLYLCSYAGDSTLDIGDDNQYSVLLEKCDVKDILPSGTSISDIVDSKWTIDTTRANRILKHVVISMTANVPSAFLETPEFRSAMHYQGERFLKQKDTDDLPRSSRPAENDRLRLSGFRSLFISSPIDSKKGMRDEEEREKKEDQNQRLRIAHLASISTSPVSVGFDDITTTNTFIQKERLAKRVGFDDVTTAKTLTSTPTTNTNTIIAKEQIAKHVSLAVRNIGGVSTIEKTRRVQNYVREVLRKPMSVLVPGGPISIPRKVDESVKLPPSLMVAQVQPTSRTGGGVNDSDDSDSALVNWKIRNTTDKTIRAKYMTPDGVLKKSSLATVETLVPSIINPLFIQKRQKTDKEQSEGNTRSSKSGALRKMNETCGSLFYIA
uniref:Uncharacterized protein n=1 Tax=Penaeus semisulcatus majanivirus TaxID=2984274 RepID=A0A9C7BLU9_9VIRU|nr:MAG: hypothetical protein [Penaeus semisulcatus majanivirus]